MILIKALEQDSLNSPHIKPLFAFLPVIFTYQQMEVSSLLFTKLSVITKFYCYLIYFIYFGERSFITQGNFEN